MFDHRTNGFTLLELTVTIAVLAIISTIAIPSFLSMIDGRRVNGVAVEIVGDLRLARTEAMRRGQEITFNIDNESHTIELGSDELKAHIYDRPNVSVSANPETINIDPRHGHPDAALEVTVTGNSQRALIVSINQVGRIRVCGTAGGHPPCDD